MMEYKVDLKICTSCRRRLPIMVYGINKHTSDGLNDKCKECVSQYTRARYKKTKFKAYQKEPGKPRPGRRETKPLPNEQLLNLRHHNLHRMDQIEHERCYRWPNKYPYRKLVHLHHVDNPDDKYTLRIRKKSPEESAFYIHDSKGNCLSGGFLFGSLQSSDSDNRKRIEDELWKLRLRIN